MKTAVIILSVLVGVLYLKWVALVLIYPFQAFHYRYRKTGKGVWKVLGAPFWLWEKICRGGWQRFALDLRGAVGPVDVIFQGGYPDSTGHAASSFSFRHFVLY